MGAAHERFVTRDVPHAMGTQSLPRLHQLSSCVLNQTRCITAGSRTLTSDEGRTARNSTALLERHDKQFFWIFADAKIYLTRRIIRRIKFKTEMDNPV